MSTPRSRRIRKRIEVVAALLAAVGVAGLAHAKQSDKGQPIHLNAAHLIGSQQNGKLVVSGNVTLDQGSFHAKGDKATGYTDANDTNQWQRVVLTGTPAHFRQTLDSGTLVNGQAQTIDYKVSENRVILTGDASVTQQGRGSFKGARLTYDTDTGAIEGNAAAGGRVHITLQPRKAAPGASTEPSPAGTPPAPPAPPTTTSAPVPASTSGRP